MSFDTDLNAIKANITPVKTFKYVGGAIVSLGAMAAVAAVFKLPINASKGITKLMMKLGVFILACKAGDIAEQYFHETTDTVVDAIKPMQEVQNNESNATK